ncbi:MAG: transcriptional regulator [Deltaproteobacteria bacterium HGW-Deltaproteobacteria-17]|nr:MAG: transcriptional regulator [Deltaproteobacteria bacterium HGW-Deltaproteobacteria-17]
MDEAVRDELSMRAEIFKAMGHPSRLLILDTLAVGPRPVTDLANLVGDNMSTVSRHLSVLRAAGLIDSRRSANQIFYYLKVPCLPRFSACIQAEVKNRRKSRPTNVSESGCAQECALGGLSCREP